MGSWLNEVRLSHARKPISQDNPALSLAEIAAVSGFFDQSHLTQLFQRFFGTTPSHFRSQQEHWANKSLRQESLLRWLPTLPLKVRGPR